MKATPWAYFDTSVLVKQYVAEPGSARARALLRRHRFLSSTIAPLEALSALYRRRSAGDLTERDVVAVVARITRDRAHWELVEVRAPVLEAAEALIHRGRLRALDAIHLGSALTVQTALGMRMPFVTADTRQREVALAQGLEVVWVES